MCWNCKEGFVIEEGSNRHTLVASWKLEFQIEIVNHKKIFTPMTPKAGHLFEINRQFVLEFCGLGKGYATAKKFTSIVNLNAPVTSQSCAEHIRSMSAVTQQLLEQDLKDDALNTARFPA